MSGPAANDANIPKHGYALSFMHPAGATITNACVYLGYPNQLLTLPRLNAAKVQAQVPPDAVLLSANYLGFATRDEFLSP